MEDGDIYSDSYFDDGPFTFGQDPSEELDPRNPARDQLTTTEWAPTLGSMVTAVAKADLHIGTQKTKLAVPNTA